MRILVVRHDKLGDLLVSTPVLQSLQQTVPNLHLTVWIHHGLGDVLKLNPYVDAIDFTELKPPFGESLKLIPRMRKGQFDKVLFLKNRAGSHVPASYFAGIPERIGCITKPYKVFLTKNLGLDWHSLHAHEAELCYQIAEAAMGVELPRVPMTLNTPEESRQKADDLVRQLGVHGDYFCVHPGTGGTSNVWHAERFGQAVELIANQTGLTPIFTGTKSEIKLVDECRMACPSAVSSAGKTDLFTLAALLKRARVMVSSNTGTMHIAASQQTPTVMVEPTPDTQQRWDKWHPWMCPAEFVGAKGVCPGCNAIDCHQTGHDCLDSINVAQVVAATMKLLNSRSAS